MNYKVGDRVKIKSLDWYNENKNELGQIDNDYTIFIPRMAEYCGKEATIFSVEIDNYVLEGIPYAWTDEMIECKVEEETKNWVDISIPDGPYTITYDSPSMNDSMSKNMTYNEIVLPNGYIFKDENGNDILTSKIILEKKKKGYPKTYEECLSVLGIYNGLPDIEIYNAKPSECKLFETLIRLKRCRDAYWKIAGEEMGLGKPWEPDFRGVITSYVITVESNKILKSWTTKKQVTLAFPTEEMRDAFKENFDPDIEICKELL